MVNFMGKRRFFVIIDDFPNPEAVLVPFKVTQSLSQPLCRLGLTAAAPHEFDIRNRNSGQDFGQFCKRLRKILTQDGEGVVPEFNIESIGVKAVETHSAATMEL